MSKVRRRSIWDETQGADDDRKIRNRSDERELRRGELILYPGIYQKLRELHHIRTYLPFLLQAPTAVKPILVLPTYPLTRRPLQFRVRLAEAGSCTPACFCLDFPPAEISFFAVHPCYPPGVFSILRPRDDLVACNKVKLLLGATAA